MSTPVFVVVSGNYLRLDKIVSVIDVDDSPMYRECYTTVGIEGGDDIQLELDNGMILRSLLDKAHELGDITLIEAGDGCDGNCDCGQGQGTGCCGYGCGACDDDADSPEDGSGTSPRDQGTDGHVEADARRPKDDPQGQSKSELRRLAEQAPGMLERIGWTGPFFPGWLGSPDAKITVRNGVQPLG